MPQVGENNEPLLSRSLYGLKGSVWVPMSINANGYLNVTMPLEEALGARGYGYISSAWQRQPLRLGYSGQVFEAVVDNSAPAGSNTLVGASVPAGEIWVVTIVAARDNNNAPTILAISGIINGDYVPFAQPASPVAGIFDIWNGQIILKEDDYIQAFFAGVTLNDLIELRYSGFRVDIDQ